ncbi:MAG: hypothetical protein R2795_02295 [Saprospiraceae bacterium]
MGHTYDWYFPNRLDPRLAWLDYSRYDGIWLGGDVCAATTGDASALPYLDSVLHIKRESTLWAWGNHDLKDGTPAPLEQATGRSGYYSYYRKGMLVLVLNTNLFWYHNWSPPQEDCEQKAAQLAWLHSVLDTLHDVQQLVVLHHHGLFNEMKIGDDGIRQQPDNISGIPVRPDCRAEGDFTQEIYPRLVDIRQRGIGVTLIAGDVGMNSKGYQFVTQDSIFILGSGINNSLDMSDPADYVTNFHPDTVLLVHHHPADNRLSWEFIRLSDLVSQHLPPSRWYMLPERVRILLEEF